MIGNPTVRRWAYAISKMFEEQLLLAFHERFSLDVVLLRFFGAYGPNQSLSWWGGPQSVFIDKALDNEAMPLHGAMGANSGHSPISPTTSRESPQRSSDRRPTTS